MNSFLSFLSFLSAFHPRPRSGRERPRPCCFPESREHDEGRVVVEGVKGGEGVGGLERVEGTEFNTLDRERLGRTKRGRGSGGGGGLWEGKLVAVVAGAVGAAETVCKHV